MHGDAKPGNFAFIGGEVSAVFDWEMTTVGDPSDRHRLARNALDSARRHQQPSRGADHRRPARALPGDQRDQRAEPALVPRIQRLQDGRHLPHRRDAGRRRPQRRPEAGPGRLRHLADDQGRADRTRHRRTSRRRPGAPARRTHPAGPGARSNPCPERWAVGTFGECSSRPCETCNGESGASSSRSSARH